VPPPPVAGAAVGNGLADRLSAADGRAEGVALALRVVALAELLRATLGVAEAVRAGENVVGVAEGDEDPVQAETDAEASMATVTQPAAVSLALSPVPKMVVVRIFMGLLMRPAGGGPIFPVPVSKGKSRACNGQFIIGIIGYAIKTPWGRWRDDGIG
jgi:hypothetical protein